jgi:hypothetical protein
MAPANDETGKILRAQWLGALGEIATWNFNVGRGLIRRTEILTGHTLSSSAVIPTRIN